MNNIPSKTLNWLLEDNNPPIRNLTNTFLLEREISQKDLKQVNDYGPIKSILSLMKPEGHWSDTSKPYKKYTGDYWQLIFLCEVHTNPTSKTKKAIEHIFTYQLPNGGFTHELKFKKPLICLTANIIRSLIHFGYLNDNRVQTGLNLITNHVLENQSVVCFEQLASLLPDCQMTLTKVLAMYSYLKKKNLDQKKAVKIISEKIAENRIFYYVPKGSKEYHKEIRGKKTAEIRQIKSKMIKQPDKLQKTESKKSWMRFGFPHSYTSDVLETLYWLAMNGIKHRAEFEDAIDLVIKRMDSAGYWLNENKFRNPMLVEIEPKKTPSKWLTFRACFVLKKYRDFVF